MFFKGKCWIGGQTVNYLPKGQALKTYYFQILLLSQTTFLKGQALYKYFLQIFLLPLQHLPNQSLDRGRENGIYRWLPEYSEIICGLPRLFVIISSSSPPLPRAAGGEDELQDYAVGQAG